ncbi:hypothetical protein BpHYR1_020919, partial [Brachionus plicatilis]
ESSSQTVCDLSDDENQQENDEDEHDEEMTNQQALKIIIQIRKHLSKSKHNFESSIDSLGSIENETLGLMVKQKTISDYFKK